MSRKIDLHIFLILISLCMPLNAHDHMIKISGSSTLYPVTNYIINPFQKKYPKIKIENTATGSSAGLRSLLAGEIDIARMSRPLKKEEIKLIRDSKIRVRPFQIGYDALCVIVHPKKREKIKKISKEQLQKIFVTGEITRWSQISKTGSSSIKPVASNMDSGTSSFFLEFLEGKVYAEKVTITKLTSEIIEYVNTHEDAIGFAPYTLLGESGLAPVPYSNTNDNFRECLPANVQNGSYDLARNVFMVVEYPANMAVSRFLDFVLSVPGQKIIERQGLIPVR